MEDLMSNARTELKASIPTMQAALQDMTPMVETVVRLFFDYVTVVSKVLTGTGEGSNLFAKEGLDIGEALAHALGTHIPAAHSQETPTKPFQGPKQPTKPIFTPSSSKHRHTPDHHIGAGAPKVSFEEQRNKLIRDIAQFAKNVKNLKTDDRIKRRSRPSPLIAFNEARMKEAQRQLTALLKSRQ